MEENTGNSRIITLDNYVSSLTWHLYISDFMLIYGYELLCSLVVRGISKFFCRSLFHICIVHYWSSFTYIMFTFLCMFFGGIYARSSLFIRIPTFQQSIFSTLRIVSLMYMVLDVWKSTEAMVLFYFLLYTIIFSLFVYFPCCVCAFACHGNLQKRV